jgi:iron complex transport system ATP-binding protein
MSALVEFSNVTVLREQRRALDGLSFRIEPGEHVAILGPNGCGKSTLIRTIHREFYPSLENGAFRLEIMGRKTWNVWDLRSMIGIVSNDLSAQNTREVKGREVVTSGFFASIGLQDYYDVTPDKLARVFSLMQELGIEHLADRWVDELSSGEVRRLVMGRALIHDPAALLFDEPCNSLDFVAQAQLRAAMSRAARKGRSVLVVTHELLDVVPEIERVILLKQGKVFADGPKHEILTSQRLSDLFEVKLQVRRDADLFSLT